MKVLVIGGGGREHALVYRLAQDPEVDEVLCTPGNAGIERTARCVDVAKRGVPAIADFAQSHGVDLTVVGPEAYLAMGLADEFRARGLLVFGPDRAGMRLESSKVFAKNFMARYGIPTAPYKAFDAAGEAEEYVRHTAKERPVVIKADGLAAGKGVVVAGTVDEALDAIDAMMRRRAFGPAGDAVVVEERLDGPELSVMALVAGRHYAVLPPARDHKRALDGDLGPNTGGMGAYAPVPSVGRELLETIRGRILEPAVRGLAEDGIDYRGCLYAGLILTREGPKVLEFNCRFGDPEAQAALPLVETGLGGLLRSVADGCLDPGAVRTGERFAVCVVAASGGYPGEYETGCEIQGLDASGGLSPAGGIPSEDVMVFHAGTTWRDGRFLTAGGRVLGVTGVAGSLEGARELAYRAIARIHFKGMHYRRDIASPARPGR